MFDVSLSELIVIGIVTLIVVGPNRLPKVARTMGHLLGRAQRYIQQVKSEVAREIELEELRQFKTKVQQSADQVTFSLSSSKKSPLGSVEPSLPHDKTSL